MKRSEAITNDADRLAELRGLVFFGLGFWAGHEGALTDSTWADACSQIATIGLDLDKLVGRLLDAATARPAAPEAFQLRVAPWMQACFGPEISDDISERCHRLYEESTETVQSAGMTRSECHQLVDYTFDRPVGELSQEVGGVMVTLAALCTASGVNMADAGEAELARVWGKIDVIRAKQAAKPKHSPLPDARPAAPVPTEERVETERVLEVALYGMVEKYTALVNCGDCGNWNPETEPEVIAARAALAAIGQGEER